MDLSFSIPASEMLAGPHGLEIHYRRRGPTDHPALLPTPGGAQSLLCWRRQMEPLIRQFQVIVRDPPGQGGTHFSNGVPARLSTEVFADAMEAVVDGLHLRLAISPSPGHWQDGSSATFC